ncbi:MAG: hypothetical protein GF335_04170 [Candidatus Moranbacteria bacterium]|nr:hypothetical protein [Candidatus Moranbacteria bacterium]
MKGEATMERIEIILSEVKNQYSETTPEESIVYENGRWLHERLSYYSSEGLGMRTCRCVSHDSYDNDQVSRKEALRLLGNKADLYPQNIKMISRIRRSKPLSEKFLNLGE